MKKYFLFLVMAVSLLMSSCLKSVDDLGYSTTTTYRGRVVSKIGQKPISNVPVALVEGQNHTNNVIVKTRTNSSGYFELKVDYKTIDRGTVIYIDGGDDYEKKFLGLQGAGKEYYDYENVVLVEKGSSVDINDYFPFSFGGHKYVVLGMSPQSYGWNSNGMSSYVESLRNLAQQLGCIEFGMSMLGPTNAFVNTYEYDERLNQYADIPFWAYEDAEEEGYVYVYSCSITDGGGVYSTIYYLHSEQSDGTGAKRLLVFGRLN